MSIPIEIFDDHLTHFQFEFIVEIFGDDLLIVSKWMVQWSFFLKRGLSFLERGCIRQHIYICICLWVDLYCSLFSDIVLSHIF